MPTKGFKAITVHEEIFKKAKEKAKSLGMSLAELTEKKLMEELPKNKKKYFIYKFVRPISNNSEIFDLVTTEDKLVGWRLVIDSKRRSEIYYLLFEEEV
ncbi:hypothetical protein HRbin06_00510 [archaeon HR06]|nr:hypothetical protein HRbin06_00510 [archaeon HR06]